MKQLAFAMYKPREGKSEALMEILKKHLPTLKEYGLISEKEPYTARSEDGTVIEVFEWLSEEAVATAHEHPAVRKLWGMMEEICDFPAMKDLPEAKSGFPDFTVIG